MNPRVKWILPAIVLPLLGLLAWLLLPREDNLIEAPPELRQLSVDSAGELLEEYEELAYAWPPAGPVPRVSLLALPEDLSELRVQDRKSVFFRSLAPLIAAENAAIRRQREFLVNVFDNPERLDDPEVAARVDALAIRYKVAGDHRDARFQRKLLTHVDVIPPGLVMAQAANESAWGTSRFAREANNLFGIWTWNKDRGMEPLQRDPDATHFVRVYSDLQAAVRNYLYTINTGGAYESLRQQRADLRAAGKPLDPVVLAGGLSRYSQRGSAYVEEIRNMITYNKLDDIRRFELRDGSGAASP